MEIRENIIVCIVPEKIVTASIVNEPTIMVKTNDVLFLGADYVQARLSLYPQADITTSATRQALQIYADDGESKRVSLEQIKNLNTKIFTINAGEKIPEASAGDYVFIKLNK